MIKKENFEKLVKIIKEANEIIVSDYTITIGKFCFWNGSGNFNLHKFDNASITAKLSFKQRRKIKKLIKIRTEEMIFEK